MNNKQFFANAYNEQRNKWMQADGNGMNGMGNPNVQQHSSAPYILQIVNSCTSAISNVDIGDAYANRVADAAFNFNLPTGITVTSTISGTDYREFLAQSESQPFTVGQTMVISSSAGQLDQTVAVTHRDSTGSRADHVITPTLDPYQNQTDRIIDDYEYLFDGFSRLRFNQINGSATVTVRFYIKNKFAATQIIAGRPAQQDYAAPNIIKSGILRIG